ncbi:hypothetical protein D3C85_971450 [compost metagenome]
MAARIEGEGRSNHDGQGAHPPARQEARGQRDAQRGAARDRAVHGARQRVESQCLPRHDGGHDGCFMHALQDAYRGQQQQQRGVGQHAAIVARLGFSAKGQRQGLGLGAAAKQIGAVPDARGRDAKPQQIGKPASGDVADERAEQPDADRAHPCDQRTFLGVGQMPHLRQQPGQPAFADRRDHGRQSDRVVRFPGVAHEEAGHDIGQSQAQQDQARQFRGGHRRQPGRSGNGKRGHGR